MRRIGTAIEVLSAEDPVTGDRMQAPGLRHWTPYLRTGGRVIGDLSLSGCGCGVVPDGMILTQGCIEDVSCEDCQLAYVRRRIEEIDLEDDLEGIGR